MKVVKLGQLNFYKNDMWGDTGLGKISNIMKVLNKYNTNFIFEYYDCFNYECDIVFYSIYDKIENLKRVKGNPTFIYWTDELMCPGPNQVFNNPFEFYKNNNLSISFYDDSVDNLFFPYFVEFLYEYKDISMNLKPYKNKYKFCTFCASNKSAYMANHRTNLVKYISKNYKKITCCGSVLNNTKGKYLSRDMNEALKYHNPYKFNLCFENYSSSNKLTYLTEKIVKAYTYKVVPIYWGATRVTEWFNKNSFINCNGLSYDQILDKIKEVDNDNELLYYMLNQYPLNEDIDDVIEYFESKLNKFIIQAL